MRGAHCISVRLPLKHFGCYIVVKRLTLTSKIGNEVFALNSDRVRPVSPLAQDGSVHASSDDAAPPPPPPPVAGIHSQTSAQGTRDRIVIIGRRRAGKTIFLARLYELLWQGCTLVDGKVVAKSAMPPAGRVTTISCRSLSGAAHSQFMRVVEELKAGRWPAATIGNSYAELSIEHNGKKHTMTALDYPGEVFRKAFMSDADEADTLELLAAIDRAAAVIFLIDPAVVAGGGSEADEDTFGLTQAAARIRAAPGGNSVPIAAVFTKCDVNRALIKEAGGVRAFAEKHFSQMFRSVERTSVFACSAVRVTQNGLGKIVPRAESAGENLVEPLRYCLELMETATDKSRLKQAVSTRTKAVAEAAREEHRESKRTSTAWLIFAVAIGLLFMTVAVVTIKLTRDS